MSFQALSKSVQLKFCIQLSACFRLCPSIHELRKKLPYSQSVVVLMVNHQYSFDVERTWPIVFTQCIGGKIYMDMTRKTFDQIGGRTKIYRCIMTVSMQLGAIFHSMEARGCALVVSQRKSKLIMVSRRLILCGWIYQKILALQRPRMR